MTKISKSKIDNLVKMLEKYPQIAILSDEIYSKIIFDKNKMPSLLNYDSIRERLIILDGWSKTFCMTGWRLGWSVWPSQLINHAKIKSNILFVGLGKTFQIWSPTIFEKFKIEARKKAFKNRGSLKWENKQKGEEA